MKRFILTVSAMLAMAFSCFAANPESDFIYDMAPDGEGVMIKQYKGTSTTVVFPDSIEGLPVTQISSNDILDYTLFPSKDKRYNITVPKSVKVIGGTAFLGVKGKINIDFSNITSIGDQAFVDSDLSGTITISKNLKFDGKKNPLWVCTAVFSKTKITAVVIEEGVTSLKAEDLFYNCPELKSVTIPASLTEIGAFAFAQCSALTEVKIPEGTKINYIGSKTFAGCTSLSLATKAKIKASGYTGGF